MTIRYALALSLAGAVCVTLSCSVAPTTTTAGGPTTTAGGPIPPNNTLVQQEQECVKKEGGNGGPWSPTLLATEQHDSNRTKLFACATFTGSLTGPNSVAAYTSPDSDNYPTPVMFATRETNELYVYGGVLVSAVPAPTETFVAKIDPVTLRQQWRTVLQQNSSNLWTGAGGIVSIGGDIYVISNTSLYKLNGTTGAIEGTLSLPTDPSAPSDSYFNGLDGWPDGTLVMKNLDRPPGCTVPGFDALYKCDASKVLPSSLVAVDSKAFKVLGSVQMKEMIGGRVTATQYQGKNYAYVPGQTNLYRYEWDGTNLTLDPTWGPVPYLLPGQGPAAAPAVMGDWVVLTDNITQSNVPMSVIAISQADSSKLTRISPIPLSPGQTSYLPDPPVLDPVNNRVYASDGGAGKIACVNFNPQSGDMSAAWTADDRTIAFMTLIGPADHRVLVSTNISSTVTNPLQLQPGPQGSNYTEQVQWRDAATGKLLAASDFFGPMASLPGPFLLSPGYGGVIYDGLQDGHIVALQPRAG